jgi:hypothetical protein
MNPAGPLGMSHPTDVSAISTLDNPYANGAIARTDPIWGSLFSSVLSYT